MVLNDYVLAIHVPGFAETFAECGCLARRPVERPTADKANHRHQWLLRTRLERPPGRANDQRDGLAPCHVDHGLPPGTRCAGLPHAEVAPKDTRRSLGRD
jgi:hypothetical protein